VKQRDFQPSSTGFIRCILCLGGPRVEHECHHCNITFPRTNAYFSKNMLKNHKDEAVSLCQLSWLLILLIVFLALLVLLRTPAERNTQQ